MTWWCTGGSSWCSLLSKQCTILLWKSDTPRTQPPFPQQRGRGYVWILVLVSLGWSTCRWAEGRFQRRRARCRSNRPLPVALMQRLSKITWRDEERHSKRQRWRIILSVCFLALTLAVAQCWKYQQIDEGSGSHDYHQSSTDECALLCYQLFASWCVLDRHKSW